MDVGETMGVQGRDVSRLVDRSQQADPGIPLGFFLKRNDEGTLPVGPAGDDQLFVCFQPPERPDGEIGIILRFQAAGGKKIISVLILIKN